MRLAAGHPSPAQCRDPQSCWARDHRGPPDSSAAPQLQLWARAAQILPLYCLPALAFPRAPMQRDPEPIVRYFSITTALRSNTSFLRLTFAAREQPKAPPPAPRRDAGMQRSRDPEQPSPPLPPTNCS